MKKEDVVKAKAGLSLYISDLIRITNDDIRKAEERLTILKGKKETILEIGESCEDYFDYLLETKPKKPTPKEKAMIEKLVKGE